MKFSKSFTTVTPFSKLLALSLFIILPVIAFYYGIYYEQKTHAGLPHLFCKEWQTVCDPAYTDPNGGCAPKKICVDEQFVQMEKACQKSGGTWLAKQKECESMASDKGLDQKSCSALGGKFNACHSACRHSDKQGGCPAVCVKTCQF